MRPRGLHLLLTLVVSVAACTSGPAPPDDVAQVKRIEEWRADRERVFREDPEQIPPEKKDKLLPLKYYPPNLGFSVPAQLKVVEQRPVFEMPTSTGTIRRMQLVGTLEFTMDGKPMSLAAFVPEGTQRIGELFVPFADLTTGTETYSAGRYLDLQPTATGFYTIDFNFAYNPTCAYNERYECPYPPSSNRLKVAIRAGEKAPGV